MREAKLDGQTLLVYFLWTCGRTCTPYRGKVANKFYFIHFHRMLRVRILIKFDMVGHRVDVINCDQFLHNNFKGFDLHGLNKITTGQQQCRRWTYNCAVQHPSVFMTSYMCAHSMRMSNQIIF